MLILFVAFQVISVVWTNNCFQQLKKSYTKFCIEKNDRLLIGDFNGDGRTDILCRNKGEKTMSIRYATSNPFQQSEWSLKGSTWCIQPEDIFIVGDFNGDKRDDILCHHTTNGYKTYNFADSAGHFSKDYTYGLNMRWCGHSGAKVHVADFNGDGKADILCHDTSKRFWFAYANSAGRIYSTSKYHQRHDCRGDIFIGDYNKDEKADVFCMNKANKEKSLLLYDGTNFRKVYDNFNNNKAWCGGYILSGDFNGDGKTDIMCHNYDVEGPAWVMKNNHPTNSRYFEEKSEYVTFFCQKDDKTRFMVGDFNGDGKDDLLCHDVAGNLQVSVSKCS